jgi:hypothetical protein
MEREGKSAPAAIERDSKGKMVKIKGGECMIALDVENYRQLHVDWIAVLIEDQNKKHLRGAISTTTSSPTLF